MHPFSRYVCVVGLLLVGASYAETIEDIHKNCWVENDHKGFSLCVKKRAELERKILVETEKEFSNTLKRSAESRAYIEATRIAFEKSVASYYKYKSSECRLRRTVSAMGNGEVDNQLACEAMLDSKRSVELKSDMWWFGN